MVIIDLLVILILIAAIIMGIKDGFFKKVFGVMGFWTGFVLATKYMGVVAGWLISWLDLGTDAAHIIGYGLIFTIVVVAVNLSYRWFGQTGKETLSTKSRIAGGLFGFTEGLVLASLLFVGMSIFNEPDDTTRRESVFYYPLVTFAPDVFDYTLSWIPDNKIFVEELKGKFGKFTLPK